ncbi:MAG: hypothetical protein IKZ82_05010 [Clostridia bacterium]|nr:hypothetical protein [Clostridia bacterium]
MYSVNDFIRWALVHVKPESLISGAELALKRSECALEPWEYLYGSVRVQTDQATLDRYYEQHYYKQMTRAQYDAITASWSRTGYATDCQGLLDAYLTYKKNEPTDYNVEANWRYWCEDKALIDETDRPYRIGEALFREGKDGRMLHVGWVCGFDGAEPLIVEARSIRYGVVISRLTKRNFTHRALMNKKFDYSEEDMPIILKNTTPMIQGEMIKSLQQALNGLGYTDSSGKKLSEDGKCGTRTMAAVTAFANNQATECPSAALPAFIIPSADGKYSLELELKTRQ